jgi:hypothetical protein
MTSNRKENRPIFELLFLPVMNGEFQETMAGMTKVQHYP